MESFCESCAELGIAGQTESALHHAEEAPTHGRRPGAHGLDTRITGGSATCRITGGVVTDAEAATVRLVGAAAQHAKGHRVRRRGCRRSRHERGNEAPSRSPELRASPVRSSRAGGCRRSRHERKPAVPAHLPEPPASPPESSTLPTSRTSPSGTSPSASPLGNLT